MRAAVMEGAGRGLTVRELRTAEPGPHEVMVRLEASGVCHTDLSALHGAFPLSMLPAVLGHEGAGVVERVGSAVTGVRVGERVVSCAAPACTTCYYCVRDEAQNCDLISSRVAQPHFIDADGSPVLGFAGLGTFAEAMTVHEASVVGVRTDLPAEQLALVGCGVVTGVGAVFNTARVEPGMIVAVIGCGGVGQSAIQAAAVSGAAVVIGIDPVELKREQARQVGASVALAPEALPGDELPDAVAALTGGRGVDVAIEAVGSGPTIRTAWDITRRGGTVVVVGAAGPDDTVTFSAAELVLSRKILKGSILAGGDPKKLIPLIVKLAEEGRFDLESLVSRTVGLDAVGSAFDDMVAGRVTRTVIRY